MKAPPQRPEWTRTLEKDEAVWLAFMRRRLFSRAWGTRGISEYAAWLAARRECGYVVEAHGHWSDEAR